MASATTREKILESVRDLPPDATVEDAMERLYFLSKIEAGLEQADRGEGIGHDEVKRRFLA